MAKSKRPAGKESLTLSLDVEFKRRFAAFSASLGEDMSLVAVRALKREMAGFSIRHRARQDGEPDHPDGGTLRVVGRDVRGVDPAGADIGNGRVDAPQESREVG